MLTPRLECIIHHVNGNIIADIGTDHAYIPIHLIENSLASYVIASDIKEGPLRIAEENIIKHGLSSSIELRLGSGLSVVTEGEADTIIIAGMGGQLISEIIASDTEKTKKSRLILQPMNAQYELRRFLHENNFKITSEDIAVEGIKVYNILCAEQGGQRFETDFEYQIPSYLVGHKYFGELYEKKHREFTKVVNGLSNSGDRDGEKLSRYLYWLKSLEKMRE